VWGFRCPARTRTIDSHAYRLRQKLSRSGGTKLVVNVWGVGYRLCDQALLDGAVGSGVDDLAEDRVADGAVGQPV
jgi:hypothetical protein